MTVKRDLKSKIRARQQKTGESYTAARVHVMRERAALLGLPEEPITMKQPIRVEAAVLKVNPRTARIRILGESDLITLRSRDTWMLVPGHIVTLDVERRWTTPRNEYVSGKIENARVDVARLGLEPLPLDGGHVEDLRKAYEPVRHPDPYAPLWRKLTAKPRPCYEMDELAWGAFPDADPDDNPTCDAAELREAGDLEGAKALLTDTLLRDLRCLDAHAHLGNIAFVHSPARALVHYEIGVRIGELSLPERFDGVLAWGCLYNRPFLRCLHGYGLALWRLERTEEALGVFERILALNPNDNQGVRFCWYDIRKGVTWQEGEARDDLEVTRAEATRKRVRSRVASTNDDPHVN